MSTEKPRFTLTLDEDLLIDIDNFRFENRYPTRTQAVLELIRRGIAQVEREQAEQYMEENYGPNVLPERQEV